MSRTPGLARAGGPGAASRPAGPRPLLASGRVPASVLCVPVRPSPARLARPRALPGGSLAIGAFPGRFARSRRASSSPPATRASLSLLSVARFGGAFAAPERAAPGGVACAASSEDASSSSSAPSPPPYYVRSYTIRDVDVRISASLLSSPSRVLVEVSADVPRGRRLLLHWGVERPSREGWSLPDEAQWPEGTVRYKTRALQTPLMADPKAPGAEAGAGAEATASTSSAIASRILDTAAAALPPQLSRLGSLLAPLPRRTIRARLELPLGGEAPIAAADFVLFDPIAQTWYDLNGDNFRVPFLGPEKVRAVLGAGASGADAGAAPELVDRAAKEGYPKKKKKKKSPAKAKREAAGEVDGGKEAETAPEAAAPPSPAAEEAELDAPPPPAAPTEPSPASPPVPPPAAATPAKTSSQPPAVPTPLSLDAVPAVPDDLAGLWAYRHWERAGCPSRSDADADAEYRAARAEIVWLLRRRASIDELRRVANEGGDAREALVAKLRREYAGWEPEEEEAEEEAEEAKGREKSKAAPAPAPVAVVTPPEFTAEELAAVPVEEMSKVAYELWQEAGQPQGADFGDAARKKILLERWQRQQQERTQHDRDEAARREHEREEERKRREAEERRAAQEGEGRPSQAPPPPPPATEEPFSSSAPESFPRVDPYDFLRDPSAAPRLSERSSPRKEQPSALEEAKRELSSDPAVRWVRRFELGDGAGLVVALKEEGGEGEGGGDGKERKKKAKTKKSNDGAPASLTLEAVTDVAGPVLLHFGARLQGKAEGWSPPPKELLDANPGAAVVGDGMAGELEFAPEDGARGEPAASDSPRAALKAVSLRVPASLADAELRAVPFVLRSGDGSRWWQDAGSDFAAPLGSRGAQGARAGADAGTLDATSQAIFEYESSSAWTLMHRCHAAADLVERCMADPAGLPGGMPPSEVLARVYIWLRYSAMRQLTWQRNYNTQPRLLGSAQDRLGAALARAALTLRGLDAGAGETGEPPEGAAEAGPAPGNVASRGSSPASSTPAPPPPLCTDPEPPRPPRMLASDWARWSLTTVGPGQDAQRVRDQILEIMHRNHISEVKGTFVEEWHQKLHNNTTPDDVAICEAFLEFYRTGGDLGAYWAKLREFGLDADRLASYDRPIVAEPTYEARLKDAVARDFGDYLRALRAVHDGLDLQRAARAAAKATPSRAAAALGRLLGSSLAPLDATRAAVEARLELARSIEALAHRADDLASDGGKLKSARDLLYLDLALEAAARAAAERGAGAGPAAAAMLEPLLLSASLSSADNAHLVQAARAWQAVPEAAREGRLGSSPDDEDAALRAVAAAEGAARALAASADAAAGKLAAPARLLGEALGVDGWCSELFAEEAVRGSAGFAAALVLGAVEPSLRRAARLGSWQLIAPGEAKGLAVVADTLPAAAKLLREMPEVAGGELSVVLLARRVTGEEDVPYGVRAVLSPDATDVLSHLAVRCRNGGVLFAACHDPDAFAKTLTFEGRIVDVASSAAGALRVSEISYDDVQGGTEAVLKTQVDEREVKRDAEPIAGPSDAFAELSGPSYASKRRKRPAGAAAAAAKPSPAGKTFAPTRKIDIPTWCGSWALPMSSFAPGKVGAKSKNLAILKEVLPEGAAAVPVSVTLPYGCFERALELPANKARKAELNQLVAQVQALEVTADPAPLLERCKSVAASVEIPPELEEQLWTELERAGLPRPGEAGRARSILALKAVWASKYNERALVSCTKAGLDFDAVRMAVLCQHVAPARYAFVIHTRNPVTGDAHEVFAEVVEGLGEAIVSGTIPGAALAASARMQDHVLEGGPAERPRPQPSAAPADLLASAPKILAYPSKSFRFVVDDSLIFRSDSNGEDLEGYAGAGLYDSITTSSQRLERTDYATDPIVADPGFQRDILGRILALGAAIHKAYGSAQDVEGVVEPDGTLVVVQTRPQA